MCLILGANFNNLAEVVVILSSVKRVKGKYKTQAALFSIFSPDILDSSVGNAAFK